jgi:hypothetical protein
MTLRSLLIAFGLLSAVVFTARPAVATPCDANDAKPALAAWTKASSLYKAANYAAAAPLFLQVSKYFGTCGRTDGNDWRLYNHDLLKGRAEAYYADSLSRLGQAVGASWFVEAKDDLAVVANAAGARPQDATEARSWISWIDTRRAAMHAPATAGPCLAITGSWGIGLSQVRVGANGQGTYQGLTLDGKISGNTWSGLWTGGWMSTRTPAPASGKFAFHTTTAAGVEHLIGSVTFGTFTDGRTPNTSAEHDINGEIATRYCY